MAPLAEGVRVSVVEVLHHRRALARSAARMRRRVDLFSVARDLRREAQPFLDRGRPDLAAPYVEEAEVLEEAANLRGRTL